MGISIYLICLYLFLFNQKNDNIDAIFIKSFITLWLNYAVLCSQFMLTHDVKL